MNESETRAHYIDPALQAKGWQVKVPLGEARMRTEFPITMGRLIGSNKRQPPKSADYVLQYRNRNIGIIEAKADTKDFTEGVGQAKEYAQRLQVRFTYSTNGKRIYRIDMWRGTESEVAEFPTPDELWEMTFGGSTSLPTEAKRGSSVPEPVEGPTTTINWHEKLMAIPFEDRGGTWQPRYYQDNAITNALDAIASGKDRILLTLATGTGKTAIAFQICWKLFHARWNLNRDGKRLPRILFLADRNILADQAFKAFNLAFEETALVRISPDEIRKAGKVPTNGSIFFTIFQTFMSGGSTGSPTEPIRPTEPTKPIEERSLSLPKGQLDDHKEEVLEEVFEINPAFGYMYILQCVDGSFYVGSTKDLGKRLEEHKSGEAANYTRKHSPVKLVYYEGFSRIDEAFNREKQIQKWSRAKKIALINGDMDLLVELSRNRQGASTGSATGNQSRSANDTSTSLDFRGSTSSPTEMERSRSESVPELAEGPISRSSDDFDPEEVGELVEPYFGDYQPDFFDFIIIDECHRAGATDASSWREIMEYFSPAVQLGLTATPKRDVNGDTYAYFGDPVYIYSLKEGINDGFLTPFRYKEISTTGDEYRYSEGDIVLEGDLDYEKTYTQEEQHRTIVLPDVDKHRVQVLMESINQNEKTIVFCENQNHALAVRNYINQIADSKSVDYCHRVTADEGKIGERHLNEFQDNQRSVPTILTTSQKLSTGVDAPEVRHVVLMRVVRSMVEFKQIIGRGTRLYDGKDYFTVHDFFWRSHTHFEDPEWDGPPLPPEGGGGTEAEPCSECGKIRCVCTYNPPEPCELCGKWLCACGGEPPRRKVVVKLADGTARSLDFMSKTKFWSKTGKPVSVDIFIQELFGDMSTLFKDEAALKQIWSMPDTRKKLLDELEEKGYSKEQLHELQKVMKAEDSDLFDVLSYISYHSKLVPRAKRAERAKVHFDSYDLKQQEFLNFVLDQYVQSGVEELNEDKLSDLLKLKYNAIADAKAQLGSIPSIKKSFVGFQKWLYGAVG